jgi:hypothetical protein
VPRNNHRSHKRRSRASARALRWDAVIRDGTGFFGYRDSLAALEARLATWRQAGDSGVLTRFPPGCDLQLVKVCLLHLAEIGQLIRSTEPAVFNTTDEVTAHLNEGAPQGTRERKREYQALHFPGRHFRKMSGASALRPVGAPGEKAAVRVVSGLAAHLSSVDPRGRVRWKTLLELLETVFPPLFTGSSIPPNTMVHERMPTRTGVDTILYRPSGDRLRSAVETYRRDQKRQLGRIPNDLAAITAELKRLQAR